MPAREGLLPLKHQVATAHLAFLGTILHGPSPSLAPVLPPRGSNSSQALPASSLPPLPSLPPKFSSLTLAASCSSASLAHSSWCSVCAPTSLLALSCCSSSRRTLWAERASDRRAAFSASAAYVPGAGIGVLGGPQ